MNILWKALVWRKITARGSLRFRMGFEERVKQEPKNITVQRLGQSLC